MNKRILFITIVLTAITYWLEEKNCFRVHNFDKLIDVSINISGVLLGFLITLKGILLTMETSKPMRFLKEAGYQSSLSIKLKNSIIYTALLLAYSLVILVINLAEACPNEFVLFIWIFFIYSMLLYSYLFIADFVAIISAEA